MKILTILGAIILGVGIIGGILFYIALPNQNADVFIEVTDLQSPTTNSHIYLKKKVWGMTSDNQIIIISTSPGKEFAPNKDMDFVYPGLAPFLYKFEHDSLFVYTLKKSNIPLNFHSHIQVIQNEMPSSELYDWFDNEYYKKLGLKMLSR